jgi:hypothetical protein
MLRAIRCANAYPNTDSNRNSERNSHVNSDANFNAYCDAVHGKMYTDAEASPYSGNPSIALDSSRASGRIRRNNSVKYYRSIPSTSR